MSVPEINSISEVKKEPEKHKVSPRKKVIHAGKQLKRVYKQAKPFLNTLYVAATVLKEIQVLPKIQNNPFPVFAVSAASGLLFIPSNIREIVDNLKTTGLKGADYVERNLKITLATTSIGCAILYSMKLSETIGLAVVGIASNSMGTIRFVLSSAAPFSAVLGVLEIINASIDIGIDAVHIHKTYKKIKKLREKGKLWGEINWQDPSARLIVSDKIKHLKAKQVTSKEELAALEGAVKTSEEVYVNYLLRLETKRNKRALCKLEASDKNAIVRLFSKTVSEIKVYRAKSKYKNALKKHANNINDFTRLSEIYQRRTDKIANWQIVKQKMKTGNLSKENIAVLDKFKQDQIRKWGIKKSNLHWKNIKIGLEIAIKTVVIVTLIAYIVLAFTGYGTLPAIISIVSLTLFIMAAKWGLSKFKKYKKPIPWAPAMVPLLL